jgi:hypothetical protein
MRAKIKQAMGRYGALGMIYCACGDSGFKGRDPGSTGGCDFTQRTIACPSCFSVSTVSERGSSAMSGPRTAGGAGVATVGVGNDTGEACKAAPGAGEAGEAAAPTSGG